DALDESPEVVLGDAWGWLFLDGSGSSHRALLTGKRKPTRRSARRFPGWRPQGQGARPVIHRSAQAGETRSRASRTGLQGFRCPSSVPMGRRLREVGVLLLGGFLLVFRPPFVVRHAIDRLAALLLAHGKPFRIGRLLHPIGKAVAAE